jgi:acetyl-CoA C-acetyltransferase
MLDCDETILENASLEAMARLEPSFAAMGAMGFGTAALAKYPTVERIEHVHHAGNSSDIVDGAAVVGSEATIMLTGPTPAARKALAQADMQPADIDLWEINEAIAAVPMKTARGLGVDLARVNVNGGSIAMGHPLGATGCIFLGTLLDELWRRGLATGCATLCVGGGMGIANVIERR